MARSSTNGFQMVTISPNVPGSIPNGMNGDFSRMTIMSSTDTQVQPLADTDPRTFVKAKRKRLSKVPIFSLVMKYRGGLPAVLTCLS